MLFLAQAENIVFARNEERFGEAIKIRGRVERVACSAPALGGEEGVGVHFGRRLVDDWNLILGEKQTQE